VQLANGEEEPTMMISKFEKQIFAMMPRVREFAEKRGNKQRDQIPQTTQVKRLHKKYTGTPLSLKAWAKQENTPLTIAWRDAK